MKHTPGPWEFVEEVQKYFWESYGPYGMERYGIKIGDKVVFIHGQGFPWSKENTEQQEWQANAHLIAAAPELLIELEGLVSILENVIGISIFENGITAFGVDEGRVHGERMIAKAKAAIAKAKGEDK